MTYSSAWIESGDDEDFATFLEQHPRFDLLPPPDRPYWINHLKEWAGRESLPIEYPDDCVVRVPVAKQQLLRFLTDMLGAPDTPPDPSTLRGYVEIKCRDDRIYAIGADEF